MNNLCPTCKKQRLKCSDGGLTCIEGCECIENSLYSAVRLNRAKTSRRAQSSWSLAHLSFEAAQLQLLRTISIKENAILIQFGAIPSKKSTNPISKRKSP